MTDQEWARAFVRCKIKGTGIRLGETVDVLVEKLAQVRREAAGGGAETGSPDAHRASPERLPKEMA